MNNNMFNKAYEAYFGKTEKDLTGNIANPTDESYTYKQSPNIRNTKVKMSSKNSYCGEFLKADDNIDNVEHLCVIISQLLNAAWGNDWGTISPDLTLGEDNKSVKLPQIVVDVNNREITDKTPIKPILTETIKETINGELTGDTILIYRQWFDCIMEFDFYGRTPKEVRKLMDDFEKFIHIYVGYLKRQGISEMLFLKETSPRTSLNFVDDVPMKVLMYYVKLERITPIRQSMINKINTQIGIKNLSNDRIEQVVKKLEVSGGNTVEQDFDLFSYDTGTIYDINEN